MNKEMEWWLTEPDQKNLIKEINALNEKDKKIVKEFMEALIKDRKPT